MGARSEPGATHHFKIFLLFVIESVVLPVGRDLLQSQCRCFRICQDRPLQIARILRLLRSLAVPIDGTAVVLEVPPFVIQANSSTRNEFCDGSRAAILWKVLRSRLGDP